ncbi:MAG: TetR family transcriptional regulator [Sporolactobacillus sp.]
MVEFIRARSTEQKLLRMNEIMETTDKLFTEHTYHEITLTTIAEALNWSRGNLYKYVTTKEEIFLELYLKKQHDYFHDVNANFADKSDLTEEAFADLWSKILDNNRDFLRYGSILATIIETNVTVERLADFKKNASAGLNEIISILEKHGRISYDKANSLFGALIFHACGLNNSCNINPLVKEAMKMAGLPELKIDFVFEFKQFMLMCLKGYKESV